MVDRGPLVLPDLERRSSKCLVCAGVDEDGRFEGGSASESPRLPELWVERLEVVDRGGPMDVEVGFERVEREVIGPARGREELGVRLAEAEVAGIREGSIGLILRPEL